MHVRMFMVLQLLEFSMPSACSGATVAMERRSVASRACQWWDAYASCAIVVLLTLTSGAMGTPASKPHILYVLADVSSRARSTSSPTLTMHEFEPRNELHHLACARHPWQPRLTCLGHGKHRVLVVVVALATAGQPTFTTGDSAALVCFVCTVSNVATSEQTF